MLYSYYKPKRAASMEGLGSAWAVLVLSSS